jgi:hypothetical protein
LVVSSAVPLNSSSKVHLQAPFGATTSGVVPAQFDVVGCVVVVVLLVDVVVVVDVDEVVVVVVGMVGKVRWNVAASANSRRTRAPP